MLLQPAPHVNIRVVITICVLANQMKQTHFVVIAVIIVAAVVGVVT